MTLYTIIMFAMLFAVVPVTGGLLAVTPWLMRRNECFAVTVPAGKQNDPRLVAIKRDYSKKMGVLTAVLSVLAAAFFAYYLGGASEVGEGLLVAVITLGTLLPIIVGFALMLSNRRKVQAIKAQDGWFAERQQVTAIVAEEEDVPGAISLAWNLLYLPILVGTFALTLIFYPQMPDLIPMKVNFAGEVTSTMPKGPGVFAFPILFVAFMAACMVFSHWSIGRSKRPTDPSAPATSALAYGMFARANSVMIVASGLLLSAVVGVGFVLSAVGVISLEAMGALVAVLAILMVVAALAISLVYGQAGSKLHARMQGAEFDAPLLFDDDEHWILGIIYFNRDDASVFLPERFGIGWTLNMARPAAWGIVIGGALLTIGFIVATFALM